MNLLDLLIQEEYEGGAYWQEYGWYQNSHTGKPSPMMDDDFPIAG